MLIPIGIEPGDETHAYGVIFPDLPGCISAGDTLEDAFAQAKNAISLYLEFMREKGREVVVQASDLNELAKNPEYKEFLWSFIEVDI